MNRRNLKKQVKLEKKGDKFIWRADDGGRSEEYDTAELAKEALEETIDNGMLEAENELAALCFGPISWNY